MLSSEFKNFYENWLKKANEYKGEDISQYFDKFFTLFVVYNRLYAEVTFLLARKGEIDLSKRKTFPDANAATKYMVQFIGSTFLIEQLEQDADCQYALSNIIRSIADKTFHIKLDMIGGDPQPQEDRKLLDKLKSTNKNTKATAILETIYSIRCNMFHGHKGFNEIQKELLTPITIILEKMIKLIYEKLENDHQNIDEIV